MAEKLSTERRSWNMGQIRSKDTKPEIIVCSLLHRMGYRFRLHRKDLPGRPDIVLPKYKTVIFVHGCFWHQHPGCIEASHPKSNSTYWLPKLNANVDRDARNKGLLQAQGWRVLRFWECEIEKDPSMVASQIAHELNGEVNKSLLSRLPSKRVLLQSAEARAVYHRQKNFHDFRISKTIKS